MTGSRGSVVSALDFQTLILSLTPVEVSLSALSLFSLSHQLTFALFRIFQYNNKEVLNLDISV